MKKFIFVTLVVSFLICLIVFACNITAHRINVRCGTNYSASDIFWLGDNIRIFEKEVIK